ncbi:SCO2523 family variant P-loop protein [Streptomyces sp. NBC_00199]|uniref:SCO2523 family variant P-loop protein n=1 Tax=Streptomyces sp. NBC_00199 TaxID=2975678 RepID=UPI002259A0C1|nr:SCO2523 family variant P-loop protein [Streptomyces sp. NBC_00199]MCX5263404.1 SCO2523 family variant P-loop protein [Streptomyces sp. NBC_00199]
MLVFAASDKGGTGRSVTSANLAYHRALDGDDVCYLDFDFGSPTAAAVFDLPDVLAEAEGRGLHSYLRGRTSEPLRVDVWNRTGHPVLRYRPAGSGRLVLLPGDRTGGEFVTDGENLDRCIDLILRLRREFDIIIVDLSAGRSYAMDLALAATSPDKGALARIKTRWLVYHRWTGQHVMAAAELVVGKQGIVRAGIEMGHQEASLVAQIRFVRAAVPDLQSPLWSQVRPEQSVWTYELDRQLEESAAGLGMGRTRVLASIPLEPVLLWREQLITYEDVVDSRVANMETWQAMGELAERLTDDKYWGQL